MKLYYHSWSANSRKVRTTAALLGVVIEERLVNLFAGEQRQPEFLKINPNGKVPVLDDNGFVLWESNAIMQYLAEQTPNNSLWPGNMRHRADIARWQFWESCHWAAALGGYFYEIMFKKIKGEGEPDATVIRNHLAKYRHCAVLLNELLVGRDFLLGEQLTLADISIAAYLMYAEKTKLPLDDYPEIRRWFMSICQLPAWQETEPATA